MEKKTVIVINGRSRVGKDTLCEIAGHTFKVRNVSSITPVKEIALLYGWDGVKDERGRKLLIALKKAFTEYNDMPMQYLRDQYNDFKRSDEEIMFVHIREPQEIERFRKIIPCTTLLIKRESAEVFALGNDNDTSNYMYDVVFENNKPLEESGADFIKLIERI